MAKKRKDVKDNSLGKAKTNNNKKIFLQALAEHRGIVTKACNATGISRTQVYKWRDEDSTFVDQINEVQQIVLDFAEDKLFEHIDNDNVPSLIFFLKCRGKERGYVERQEITGKDGQELPAIQVIQTSAEPLSTEEDVRDNFNID
jgi:hypothetical protein